MPGNGNDEPEEPGYSGATHNPFNPFQKIRSMEDAADTAKIGAIVTLWLALRPALQLGHLLNADRSLYANAVTFYSIAAVNAGFLLVTIWFTWIILRKQRLWTIAIVLICVVVQVVAGVVSHGGVGIVSLIMMVIAAMSFRGALAMRRFKKQEAGSPAEG